MENHSRNDYMIAWDPAPNLPARVRVGVWPDGGAAPWSDDYMLTTGCCDSSFHEMGEQEQAQALVNLAADMMLSDGISPRDILTEFAKIRVWREMGITLPSGHFDRAFDGSEYGVFSPNNPLGRGDCASETESAPFDSPVG